MQFAVPALNLKSPRFVVAPAPVFPLAPVASKFEQFVEEAPKFIGTFNQVARTKIVDVFTTVDYPFGIAEAVQTLIHDENQRATMRQVFQRMKDDFNGLAAENATAIIGAYLAPRRPPRRNAG